MKIRTKQNLRIDNVSPNQDEAIKIRKNNLYIFYFIIFLIFSILLYTLFDMQIVNGNDYLRASNLNYKSASILRAPRGIIYDINGKKLVFNKQIYSIYLDPYDFNIKNDLDLLSEKIQMSPDEIKLKLENDNVFGRVTLKTDLTHDEYLSLVNQIELIRGVYIRAETGRAYIDNEIYTNIIGYLGDPSESDINEKVDPFSRIGKTGLESKFDYNLRGEDGLQISEVDIRKGDVSRYESESPIAGDNIILTLDHDWQSLAYNFLKDKTIETGGLGGGIVIMDVESGDIKVLSSYPTVDVSKFTSGISTTDFQVILDDPRSPLLDRSIGVAIPTGSIFKSFSAAIGLEEGAIDYKTIFNSPGCIDLPGGIVFCESLDRKLGDVDIYKAISLSSNIYFCRMAGELSKKENYIETLLKYTDSFGVGKTTGIILPGEASGTMATPEFKQRVYGEPWYIGDTCNTLIGQGLLSATPIQMAVAMAAIENNGKILEPKLIESTQDYNGELKENYETKVIREVPIKAENFETVKDAMERAIRDQNGTVRKLAFYDSYIIGKTGTATATVTIGGKKYDEPHAWVMGVFEYQGKKYSFALNIAHGGWGEQTVDVIKQFLENLP